MIKKFLMNKNLLISFSYLHSTNKIYLFIPIANYSAKRANLIVFCFESDISDVININKIVNGSATKKQEKIVCENKIFCF